MFRLQAQADILAGAAEELFSFILFFFFFYLCLNYKHKRDFLG